MLSALESAEVQERKTFAKVQVFRRYSKTPAMFRENRALNQGNTAGCWSKREILVSESGICFHIRDKRPVPKRRWPARPFHPQRNFGIIQHPALIATTILKLYRRHFHCKEAAGKASKKRLKGGDDRKVACRKCAGFELCPTCLVRQVPNLPSAANPATASPFGRQTMTVACSAGTELLPQACAEISQPHSRSLKNLQACLSAADVPDPSSWSPSSCPETLAFSTLFDCPIPLISSNHNTQQNPWHGKCITFAASPDGPRRCPPDGLWHKAHLGLAARENSLKPQFSSVSSAKRAAAEAGVNSAPGSESRRLESPGSKQKCPSPRGCSPKR